MGKSAREHIYNVSIRWTGDAGSGTSNYAAYRRDHEVWSNGKPPIPGSSDPSFRGDRSRYNPEEFLVASLASCHMLWYLHLCADARVVVTAYTDDPQGTMMETEDGGGRFTAVVLRPRVVVKAGSDRDLALSLHEKAHHLCFIANSVNFSVTCNPTIDEG